MCAVGAFEWLSLFIMDKEQLIKQCQMAVQQSLDNYSDHLISELSRSVLTLRHPNAFFLSFDVYSEGFSTGFPVIWRLYAHDYTEMAKGPQLLQDISCLVPSEVIDAEAYRAADLDTWNIAFHSLVAWFGECWRQAGGLQFPYPVQIGHADDIEAIDLKTMISCEKWPDYRE